MDWATAIRKTAKKNGQTLTEFRDTAGIPNGSFYNLLQGKQPKVTRTMERLIAAGVPVPAALRKLLAA